MSEERRHEPLFDCNVGMQRRLERAYEICQESGVDPGLFTPDERKRMHRAWLYPWEWRPGTSIRRDEN